MNVLQSSKRRTTYGTSDLLQIINESIKVKETSNVSEQIFQLTDGFICTGCLNLYEKKNLLFHEDTSEEDLDTLGFDLNPEMEEETKCVFCLKKKKTSEARCLFKGYPSCKDCAKRKLTVNNTNETLDIDSINQMLNDSFIANLSTIEKKPELQRKSTVSKLPNAFMPPKLDFKSLKLSGGEEKRQERRQTAYKEIKEFSKSPTKKSMFVNDYTHKEIDNKIMNLVSTKNNMDFKFRKNTIHSRQVEKMCKSLEYIFENTSKISINLPIIFRGVKNEAHDSKWLEKLEQNGNFLFVFLDCHNEFLFGFVIHTFSSQKAGKFFKKFQLADNESLSRRSKLPPILYLDEVLENIQLSNNLISSDCDFTFDLSTFLFTPQSIKLSKFLLLPHSTLSLCAEINKMNIFDMC